MAIGIHCCKDCVPPKRHSGCHATCKEYKDEKAQYDEDKKKVKEHLAKTPNMTTFDFNKICYADSGRGKRKR